MRWIPNVHRRFSWRFSSFNWTDKYRRIPPPPNPGTLPHICLNAGWRGVTCPSSPLKPVHQSEEGNYRAVRDFLGASWSLSSRWDASLPDPNYITESTANNLATRARPGLPSVFRSRRGFLTTGALLNSHESDLWEVLSGYKLPSISSARFSPKLLWPALSIPHRAGPPKNRSLVKYGHTKKKKTRNSLFAHRVCVQYQTRAHSAVESG